MLLANFLIVMMSASWIHLLNPNSFRLAPQFPLIFEKNISLNLGGWVLIVLLGLAYWLNTGARAVPGLVVLA